MMMNSENHLPQAGRVITVPRFEARHIFYMILCLAGAAAALYLFWRDLNLTLARFQDEPLGTVIRKQNTAQRRFEDRTLWDRLRRQSPVYSGDYIRTAELSEAAVLLTGGDLVEIGELTLIRIVETPEGPALELNRGAIQAGAGSGGLTVTAAGASLRAEAGSLFSVSAGEGAPEAAVMAGSVLFQGEEETRTLGQGEAVSGSPARAVVLSPRPGAVFLNTSDKPLSLPFVRNRQGFASREALRLEVAGDRAFTNVLLGYESFEQSLSVELENGVYYWRAYPAGQSSPSEGVVSGKLSIIDARPPELISPAEGEEFGFTTLRPGLRFLWTSCDGAGSYHIEVSQNPDMTNPLYQRHIQDSGGALSSIVHSGFETGTWYWRVRPEYPRGYEGTAPVSRTGSFRIRRRESLAAPVPYVPAREGGFYREDKKEEAYFSWKQEKDAASYTFLLSQSEDLGDPLIKQKVEDNYFAYDLKNGSLAPGRYYWGVYQTDSAGSDSALSAVRSVLIIAGPPPEGRSAAVSSPPPAGESLAAEPGPPEEEPPDLAAVSPAPPAREVPPAATAPPPPAREAPPAAAAPPPSAMEVPPAAAVPEPPPNAAPPVEPPEPVPELRPLPAPVLMRPASGFVFTEDIIIRERQIAFSWNAVPGASGYVFILYQVEGDGRRELFRLSQSETSFTIRDLSVLDAGTFVWRVEPRSRIAEQESEGGEGSFIISIEETRAAQGRESGVLFGKN
jgi:hypothetical protein